jgi:hypothetical protein
MGIGEWLDNVKDDGLETKQLIGIAGTAVTFIGVFTPIEKLELIGNSSLIGSDILVGILILVLAVATLVLSLINRCRWLWATGVGIILAVAAGVISILAKEGHLQWGWGVLFVGAILIITAAAIEETSIRKNNARS